MWSKHASSQSSGSITSLVALPPAVSRKPLWFCGSALFFGVQERVAVATEASGGPGQSFSRLALKKGNSTPAGQRAQTSARCWQAARARAASKKAADGDGFQMCSDRVGGTLAVCLLTPPGVPTGLGGFPAVVAWCVRSRGRRAQSIHHCNVMASGGCAIASTILCPITPAATPVVASAHRASSRNRRSVWGGYTA